MRWVPWRSWTSSIWYTAIGAESRKEHALLRTLKAYQAGTVKLLVEPDDVRYRLRLNDRLGEFMYPDVFLQTYAQDRTRIFDALVDTVDPLQSTENLFVSNLILMNYSFHVLKENPRDLLALERHVDDASLFGRLLEALIHRRMAVSKALLQTVPLDHDVSSIKDNQSAFFNILYSL